MLKIDLIRHGKTYGNTLGRYIGTTDEPLCQEGRSRILEGSYPTGVQAVYVSPMKRCLETAGLIYPDLEACREPLLRECDFGAFENRNYQELSDNPDYQAWVDSGGTLPFPGGESHETFQERCRRGFLQVLRDMRERSLEHAALVVHGGTIMSILEAFGEPKKSFYHWQVKNGGGYEVLLDEEAYEKRDEVRLYEIHAISPGTGLSD